MSQVDIAHAPEASTQTDALTAVVLTRNSVVHLPRCLKAIPDAYPVLIIDGDSDDGSRQLAERLGYHVVRRTFRSYADQRNFALQDCGVTTEWVLFVDPDEIFPPAFFAWFEESVKPGAAFDVAQVPGALALDGVNLRHPGEPPFRRPRLVRRERVTFVEPPSGRGEMVNGAARQIDCAIPFSHPVYDGRIGDWMRAQVGAAEAEAARQPGARNWMGARVPARFLYHYVLRGGFRDGGKGFRYAAMQVWLEMTRGLVRGA